MKLHAGTRMLLKVLGLGWGMRTPFKWPASFEEQSRCYILNWSTWRSCCKRTLFRINYNAVVWLANTNYVRERLWHTLCDIPLLCKGTKKNQLNRCRHNVIINVPKSCIKQCKSQEGWSTVTTTMSNSLWSLFKLKEERSRSDIVCHPQWLSPQTSRRSNRSCLHLRVR